MSSADYNELADVIERFVNGTSPPWEWDDYSLGKTYKDPFLASVQRRMISVATEFPSASKAQYTSLEGVAVLVELVRELRSRSRT